MAGDCWFRAQLGAMYRKSSSGQNGWRSFAREALFNPGAFLREITLAFLFDRTRDASTLGLMTTLLWPTRI